MQSVLERRSHQYLMDSASLISDYNTLTQLHLSAITHGYSSPLWMTAAYAHHHKFSMRFLCTPLNIWIPGCGETFYPARMSHLAVATRQASGSLIPPPSTASNRNTQEIQLCVCLEAPPDKPGLHYAWCVCPRTFEPLFLSRSLDRLWLCSSLVAPHDAASRSAIAVRTPDYDSQMINTDQLADCTAVKALVAEHYHTFLTLRGRGT